MREEYYPSVKQGDGNSRAKNKVGRERGLFRRAGCKTREENLIPIKNFVLSFHVFRWVYRSITEEMSWVAQK